MKRTRNLTYELLRKKLAMQLCWISQMAATDRLTGVAFGIAQVTLRWTLKLLRRFRPAMVTSVAIGAPLVAALTESADAQARFDFRSGDSSPFSDLEFGLLAVPSPYAADVDSDGDFDLVVGDYEGNLVYLENTATPKTAPSFRYRPGDSNPFDEVRVGEFSAPALADLDNDGDLDAIIAEYTPFETPLLNYFQNDGSARSPFLVERTGVLSPVNDLTMPEVPMPVLADLDGDGDFDMTIGSQDGRFRYFLNTGGRFRATFIERLGVLNPFNGLTIGGDGLSTPALGDVDRDGDLDLVSGGYDGVLYYFENIGTTRSPRFARRFGDLNPFSIIDVGRFSDPTLADFDGDGDVDLVVGEGFYSGAMAYFENTDPNSISGFPVWQAANFRLPAEAAIASPDADPDQDGRSNIIEFGLRSPPRVRSYFPVIAPIINANGVLSYTVNIRDDSGLTVYAQFSDSPEFRNPSRINPVLFDPFPGDDAKLATFIDVIDAAEKRSRFMRLVFEL